LTILGTIFSLILTLFFYFLSIALIFVSIPLFLCKLIIVSKVVMKKVVQITQLKKECQKNKVALECHCPLVPLVSLFLSNTLRKWDRLCIRKYCVGTKGVSQVYHLSFDDNKVLKIINWILLKVYSSVQDH